MSSDRPFIKTVVQLAIGVLFIAISATVTPASLRGVIWPALALVALLVLVVRPAVAVVATARSSLTRNERIFIGCMDPRRIVAASTAASFTAPLVALHIGGADKLLPATFLVIVGTVAIYGLTEAPLARALGLRQPQPEHIPAESARAGSEEQHRVKRELPAGLVASFGISDRVIAGRSVPASTADRLPAEGPLARTCSALGPWSLGLPVHPE